MRRVSSTVILSASCLVLQGCAAALVPAAAAGLAARHHMKANRETPAPQQVAGTDASPAAAVNPAGADLEEMPSDPARMQPGKLYRGTLPGSAPDAPAVSSAAPPAPPEPAPAVAWPDARPATDWNDLSRYVAGHFAQSSPASVLLVPGSTLAAPRWVPCGAKPVAVLVDLDAVVPPAGPVSRKAADVLGAVETLQVTVVYTAHRTGRALDAAVAALAPAGLHRPEGGSTVFPVAPDREGAVRASVGARYCVVAIAGDRAEDFPNRATPEAAGPLWNEGWFLMPHAG